MCIKNVLFHVPIHNTQSSLQKICKYLDPFSTRWTGSFLIGQKPSATLLKMYSRIHSYWFLHSGDFPNKVIIGFIEERVRRDRASVSWNIRYNITWLQKLTTYALGMYQSLDMKMYKTDACLTHVFTSTLSNFFSIPRQLLFFDYLTNCLLQLSWVSILHLKIVATFQKGSPADLSPPCYPLRNRQVFSQALACLREEKVPLVV